LFASIRKKTAGGHGLLTALLNDSNQNYKITKTFISGDATMCCSCSTSTHKNILYDAHNISRDFFLVDEDLLTPKDLLS